ncbi:hypothetical protein ACFVWX_19250 [Streptomyces sp. NPDC058220]|uniref:hypothetical protein n=1 Tax=unclassified Streptomyces TaxID=2593676 RepID=UPI0036E124E5
MRRETDPADRRVSRVVLTDEGRKVGEEMSDAFACAVAERCATVPRTDLARLARIGAAAADALGDAS